KKAADEEGKSEKKDSGKAKPKDEKPDEKAKGENPATAGLISFDAAATRWGVEIARAVSPKAKPRTSTKTGEEGAKDQEVAASLADADTALEPDLPYRSAIYFKDLQPTWRVLYR